MFDGKYVLAMILTALVGGIAIGASAGNTFLPSAACLQAPRAEP
ncbi:hypothetical protein [Acidimangrovimonas pyrenivorans]|uniref:Uncharacterized protein n=1 Tax=Acidimangrovimonas pyrenivorans TaxID=2030798 RepID=A0ABV7AN88_9RHOB